MKMCYLRNCLPFISGLNRPCLINDGLPIRLGQRYLLAIRCCPSFPGSYILAQEWTEGCQMGTLVHPTSSGISFPLSCYHLETVLEDHQILNNRSAVQGGSFRLFYYPTISPEDCLFYRKSRPKSNVHLHQIRRVATSLKFFKYLCFEYLKSYKGWKSPMYLRSII